MAWVTPTNVATGDVLTASTWNQDVVANAVELAGLFGAWTDWSATLSQSSALNVTRNTTGTKYLQIGKLVIASFRFDGNASTSGSAGQPLTLGGLPVNAVEGGRIIGVGAIYDNNTNTRYGCAISLSGATTATFIGDWAQGGSWGSAPSLGLANGDQAQGLLVYEAA